MHQTEKPILSDSKTMGLIQKNCKGKKHLKLTVGTLSGEKRIITVFDESGEVESKDYVYEIGSIGKTLTATLLAKYVCENRMSLDDLFQNYMEGLDHSQYYPNLSRLATHTSGYGAYAPFTTRETLKLFTDMAFGRNQGLVPFNFDLERIKAFIQKQNLQDQDYKWKYSNLGYALIGHALGVVSGKGYADTMDEFLSQELGLPDTYTGIRKDKNLHGFTKKNVDCGNWDLSENFMAPSGSISSTAIDLLSYARLNMQEEKPYLSLCQQKHANASKKYDMGLGWWLHKANNKIMEHEGGTGAFGGFLIIDKDKEAAVVVLANYRLGITSERDIGLSVLKNLQESHV